MKLKVRKDILSIIEDNHITECVRYYFFWFSDIKLFVMSISTIQHRRQFPGALKACQCTFALDPDIQDKRQYAAWNLGESFKFERGGEDIK